MENELLKLNIQLFAEDSESEQADNDDETLETNEEEFTDSNVEKETSKNDEDAHGVDESEETDAQSKESAKSLKELLKERPDLQNQFNDIMQNRLTRETKRLDREHQEQLSKYQELGYLTQKGINAEDLDDALIKSRDFYSKQGIKYTPQTSQRDEEILANADSKEIIDSCNDENDLIAEADKIAQKGINMSSREKVILKNLKSELENIKGLKDLEKIGADKKVYESDEFKKFSNHFTKETPMSDVYDLYITKNKTAKKIENPGSMKNTTTNKTVKDFYTIDEARKYTTADLNKNPELFKAIENSMSKW